MPYTVDSPNLPANVKKLPDKAKARWVATWNSAYTACEKDGGDDCEGQAFRIANGTIRESDIDEAAKRTVTAGMANAMGKGNTKIKCSKCGQSIPVYPGRYPSKCPNCGEPLSTQKPAQEALDDLLLLSTEREVTAVQEAEINRLITTEANDVDIDALLVTLQEQAAMKTEDGQKFPAAAFAYVPDPEKPSTWKLRLWETPQRTITRKQLGAAAAAFSPSGFRRQHVQIPAGDVAKVKGRIRAAYKALNVEDKNIPKSVQEAEPMKRLLAREATALTEADYDADKGEVTVTVIKPGFNTSKKRYYPKDTLERDFKVFEGLKMFADHQTPEEERAQPERSIRSWVGSIKKVFTDADGTIKARAAIIEPWMKEKLSNLKDAGLLHEMGTSIVASGEGRKTDVDGHETHYIERLVHGRSVDFVTYPGAGGQVECYESAQPEDEYDIDVIDVEGIKERRPDLVERITVEIKESLDVEVTQMTEVEKELKTLKESNETLTAENDGLKTKVAATEAADAKRIAQDGIAVLIKDAELPDATKARLTEQFKEAGSVDGVAEAIEAARVELAALMEAGKIKDLGHTKPVPPKDNAEERLIESRTAYYIEQGHDEEQAKRMAVTYAKGR